MALNALQKNRSVRREALKEQLSVQCHYQHMVDVIGKMTALANGDIDQDGRDRFSMLSVIADKHWRVIDRYLPALPAATAQQSPSGTAQSALQRAVGLLAQRITLERIQPTIEPMRSQAGQHPDDSAS